MEPKASFRWALVPEGTGLTAQVSPEKKEAANVHHDTLTLVQKSPLWASGSNEPEVTVTLAHGGVRAESTAPEARPSARPQGRGAGGRPAPHSHALALPGPRPGRGEKFPAKVHGTHSRSQPPNVTASPLRRAARAGPAAALRPVVAPPAPRAGRRGSPTTEPGEEQQREEQQQQQRRRWRRGRQQEPGPGGRSGGKLCFAASGTQRRRPRGPRHSPPSPRPAA